VLDIRPSEVRRRAVRSRPGLRQGRSRLIPASAIAESVALLESEARAAWCLHAGAAEMGGLSWDENRQRWVVSLTVGYTSSGRRIVKRGRGRTRAEASANCAGVVDSLFPGRDAHA
jgi:hypothetical protein